MIPIDSRSMIPDATLVSDVGAADRGAMSPSASISNHRDVRRRSVLASVVAMAREEEEEKCTHCWRRELAGADRAAPAG